MISFEDLVLIFYICIPNTKIKDTMEKIQFKQHITTTFRCLTKKIMVLLYWTFLFIYLTMLAPINFDDKFWRSHLDIIYFSINTTMKGATKIASQLKQQISTTFRCLKKKKKEKL